MVRLHLDVVVRPVVIDVWARALDGPEPCGNRFAEVGQCGGQVDSPFCDTPELDWVWGFALERDHQRVAAGGFFLPGEGQIFDPGLVDLHGLTFVVVGKDGETARVELPEVMPPEAHITRILDNGTDLTMFWSSDSPPTSLRASIGNGLFAYECHMAPVNPVVIHSELAGQPLRSIALEAFAPAVVRDTPLAEIHFWVPRGATGALEPE